MIDTLKKVWLVFTPAERRRALVMLLLVILMALAETGGVVSIMPFLSVLSRPEIVQEKLWLQHAFDVSGASSTQHFILLLGLASVTVVLLSSVFKTVTLHALNRFVHLERHSISSRLLARYLHQPYAFFLSRSSSDLSKNILSETDQLLFNLVQPLSQLIAQGAVILAMALLVFFYDPMMALGILLGVSLLYGAI